MLRALAVAFIFLAAGNTYGQLPADIKFTNYTRANGLPEEYINSITQDSRGFLWIGSREGLIRFDGHNYKAWYANPADSSVFNSNNILVVKDALPGAVLFLSGSQLWQIDIFNHRLSQPKRFRNKIMIARPCKFANGYWGTADSDTAFILNSAFEVIYSFPLKPYFPANTMVSFFPLSEPFVLMNANGLNQYNLLNYTNGQVTPVLLDNTALDTRSRYYNPLAWDSTRQRLYLAAYFDGNYYIDMKLPGITRYSPVPVPLLPDGSIRKALLLPGDRMMLAGDNGLYLTDFREVRYFKGNSNSDKPLPSNVVVDICAGNDGNYWLSTINGISRFSLENFAVRYFRKELSLDPDDEFKSIVKGADGNIYFLTRNKSLTRINAKDNAVKLLDSTIFFGWSAARKGNEIIFTGAGKRLASYDILSGKITNPACLQPFYGPTTDLVTLVFVARNGDTWYSCNGGSGLIRNPAGTSEFIQYSRNSTPPAFSHRYVHTAAEDSHGNIWWGSNKTDKLLKWEAARERFTEYTLADLAPEQKFKAGISAVYADHNDNLWIALDGAALLKFNPATKQSSYYDINKGLPTDAVFSMCSDSRNRLWFGTRKGLCCYLPDKDKVVAFTNLDGFPEENFDGNGLFYDESTNILYAGARQSISYFNPDSLINKAVSFRPSVYIDEMMVNGKTFYFSNEQHIRLAPDENNLAFTFAVPDFARNNQLVFQYQLRGAVSQWTDLDEKRSVSFNNLPHGKYTLSVRCRYKGTETWKETSSPFTFIIQTPWSKSWWFRSVLAGLLFLVIWFAIRTYYRRKMEKQHAIMEKEIAIEQERTKMARELHDGLGSMLSGIKHSFAAMNKEFTLTEKQQVLFHSNLDKLNESIKELRNITHNMASDALLKYGIENSLRDYCANISGTSGIAITFTALHTENVRLSEERSFHIFRIMQELLQNVIKHSLATRVLVQISSNKNLFYITVEDNGSGFDLQDVRRKKSMGLRNIETRVKLLKGELDIQTAPGKGTSVLITLPGD